MGDSHNTFLDTGSLAADSNMESRPSRTRLYFSVAILNLAYIICGTTYAWSSPVLMKLELSDGEGSTVASALSLGMILGPSVCGAVLDRTRAEGHPGPRNGVHVRLVPLAHCGQQRLLAVHRKGHGPASAMG
ncbi:uncharacterized protein LOC124374613 [Homalodisca vitripennis]|uniref:uncharacterized protein LOC124374613 n=1 Tax=Homalodisca vitripennis TaxID=197043 RepID=UPI001EEB94FD|nr:uncharacterized protein LOC124374613 [Homalodisca vitripennis]